MSEWGKTGRVTLGLMEHHFGDRVRNVLVDGKPIGRAFYPRKRLPFRAFGGNSYLPDAYREGLPSLDAAIMWVLRRAAPKVWREERGPVVRVEPMWPLAAFSGLTGLARPRRAATRWVVDAPDGRPAETFQSWPDAMRAATS